jgi:hypothetical protein
MKHFSPWKYHVLPSFCLILSPPLLGKRGGVF